MLASLNPIPQTRPMKFARITMVQPRETRHPMQNFLEESDSLHHERLLAWTIVPWSDVWYLLFHADGDREAYRDAIDDVDAVIEYDLTPAEPGSFYVYVVHERRENDVDFMTPFAARNLVIVPPIEYTSAGETKFTIVGDPGDIGDLVEDVPDRILVEVDRIGEYDHRYGTLAGRLTDRQREAVAAAVDVGYYEVPSEATLEEVADRLDCTAGTASTILSRAEKAVMQSVLGR